MRLREHSETSLLASRSAGFVLDRFTIGTMRRETAAWNLWKRNDLQAAALPVALRNAPFP